MSKINLTDVSSGYDLSRINDNFQEVARHLNDKVLYRDNPIGEPNSLNNDVDMNGKRLYNLTAPTSPNEAARLKDVQDAIAGDNSATLVSFEPYKSLESTNVQGAIQELEDDLTTISNDFVNKSELADTTDPANGAAMVGFKQPYAGAVARTQYDKDIETVSILDFGGAADGVTDNAAAGLAAKASLTAAGILRFPASGSNTYLFTGNLGAAGLAGLTLDVDPGVTLEFPSVDYLPPSLRVTRPTKTFHTATSDTFWLSPKVNIEPTDKAMWLGQAERDLSTGTGITGSSLSFKTFNGDTVSTFSPTTSASAFAYAPPVSDNLCVGLARLRFGQELTGSFVSQAGINQVALVRHTAGYIAVLSGLGNGGGSVLYHKKQKRHACRCRSGLPGQWHSRQLRAAKFGIYDPSQHTDKHFRAFQWYGDYS